MKLMKKEKTAILATLFALTPAKAFAENQIIDNGIAGYKFEGSRALLRPGQTMSINFGGERYLIKHSQVSAILNKIAPGYDLLPVGVNIHEESKTVDFSSHDHITIRVPLDKISHAPPNMVSQ